MRAVERARRQREDRAAGELVDARAATLSAPAVSPISMTRGISTRVRVLTVLRRVVVLQRGHGEAGLEQDPVGERVGPRHLLQPVRPDLPPTTTTRAT